MLPHCVKVKLLSGYKFAKKTYVNQLPIDQTIYSFNILITVNMWDPTEQNYDRNMQLFF
jgi:hypothetical protein